MLYILWCTTRLYTGSTSLLYINDLSFACKWTVPLLFADDSNLFLSGKKIDHVQQMINDELKDIIIICCSQTKELYNQMSQLKSMVNL